MARYRLSTDILSPLNSDISLNDVSAFSFGSLPDAPVFDSNIASPLHSANSKESDISLLCATNMKECASAFDEVTSDFKKQSSLNSETEELYQNTFEELKKSIDDLFGKDSYSPIFPSQLKNKSNDRKPVSMHSKANTIDKFQSSKSQKRLTENHSPDAENTSEIIKEKSEKCINKKSIANKLKKSQHQSKQTSSVSEPLKRAKNKSETCIRTDASVSKKNTQIDKKTSSKIQSKSDGASCDAKKIEACIRTDASVGKKKNALIDKKTNSKILSKSDGASCDVKKPTSKKMPEKKDDKGAEDIRGYNFKCQKKIPVSVVKPFIESKSLSMEKSVQLAVSMEMDNMRRFVLSQNLLMRKDLLELQETAKRQNEVTEYLFSVINELLDTNKQLISKYK